jgi:hypothetical protein
MGAGNAHRALILIEAGPKLKPACSYPLNLGDEVRKSVARRLQSSSGLTLQDELDRLHAKAYSELLNGLMGCGAFWDGLIEAKTALTFFPNDVDLLDSRDCLKLGFQDQHNGLKDAGPLAQDLVALTRTGKIYQKLYPWVDEKLYMRSSALLREVNKTIGLENCEIRPVVFDLPTPKPGKSSAVSKRTPTKDSQDVGPLGVFATRNIKEGEIIMVDKCLTGISDIPSSQLVHCDACHASLSMPYIHPSEISKPRCCNTAAYCSKVCLDTAVSGYHAILCGKNWDWLYSNPGTTQNLTRV